MSNSGNFGNNTYNEFLILLVVVWSCDISNRKSIDGSSFCNGVVGVMNIVSVFVLVQAV